MSASKRLPRILVVGSCTPVVECLEGSRRYRFEHVTDSDRARAAVTGSPDAVLLELPADRRSAEQALSWIATCQHSAPVVVLSTDVDMNLYLTAMSQGAFDLLTSHTSVEEILRVLDNAVSWHEKQAA